MIYIYALIDPITDKIRYIGKTTNPEKRFKEHCNDKNIKLHRVCWINSLKKMGCLPQMDILEKLPDNADWQYAEKDWISFAKRIGCDLTNGTNGGEGLVNITDEIKEKRRRKLIGVKHSEERKRNISIARKRAMQDPELRLKMKQAIQNRKISKSELESSAQKRRSLSLDDVLEIKDLISKNVPVKDIAEKLGIKRYTVHDIKRGKNYKDVYRGACSDIRLDYRDYQYVEYSPQIEMLIPDWLRSSK